MNEDLFDYVYSREDHEFVSNLPEAPMHTSAWKAFSRPDEVLVDWHRTENQGPIGSCQGHSLSSCLERLAMVRGEMIQLSEIFAYLATQKVDGLLGGDRGSTISGGCKVGMEYGCPPESLTGYPRSYPSRSERARILGDDMYAAGIPYKAKSLWKVPRDHEQVLDFIGGGGGINFGIAYGGGTIPSDRVIRNYRPGRGGHAMAILGYNKEGWLRAVNSHGDGEYFITPEGWSQIMNHRSTTAIGMMGNEKAEPVNWYKNSPYFQ